MKFKKLIAGLTAVGVTITSMPGAVLQVKAENMQLEQERAQEENDITKEGLVLQVDFDDETADDHSGRENHGEIVGEVEFVEGVKGQAIHIVNSEQVAGEYQKAEQYVNFKEREDFKFGSENFSVLFWYKADCNDYPEGSILGNKDWDSGGNTGFCIADFREGLGLNFRAEGGARLDSKRINKATDNQWHHVAAVFDRENQMTLYVDGENTTQVDLSGDAGKSIDFTDLVLGADGKKNFGVKDSYIDELQIFKRAVTEQEIEDVNSLYDLKTKIAEYESLLQAAEVSEEKKKNFEDVLIRVKETLQNTVDSETLQRLHRELEIAYHQFKGPEKGKIEFEVLSDIHVTEDKESSQNTANWIDALQDVETYFPDSAGIITCGDLSQDGNESQFAGYYNALENHGKNIKNVMSALGNHDVRWKSGWEEIYERYLRYNQSYMGETNGKVYYDKWIDGYHFVVLNTEWDLKDQAFLSDEQLNWLEDTMKKDTQEGKPIFVFLHQSLKDTFFNSNDWNEGMQDHKLKEILRNYPQTILFSGHIHNGLGACSVIEKEYGTMVDVPAFVTNENGSDRRGQIGYHVSVYDGKVQLSMRDYKNNEWLEEYNTTIDLNNNRELPGKVLEMNFDDEDAKDSSGNENHGTLVGNPDFVEGVHGKALQITNSRTVAGIEKKAEQYLELQKNDSLEFGTNDFTISYWAKVKSPENGEGAMITNKDWTTGANQGFVIGDFAGDRPGFGLNFAADGQGRLDTERYSGVVDGTWHQVTAIFKRNGDMSLYVDGKKRESKSINSQAGKSIDTSFSSIVVGADANGQFGMELMCIDELKIYKKALGEAEVTSIYNPYKVETQQTSALIKWNSSDDENIIPIYLVLNNKKYLDIASGTTSKFVAGLEPGCKYEAFIVTAEKDNTGNLKDGYSVSFQTKADLKALKEILESAQSYKREEYEELGFTRLQEIIRDAKILTQEDTQEVINEAIANLENAINDLKRVEQLTEVKSITLDKQNVELKIGENETIVATVETNDGTTPSVEWSSANEKVATVKDGVITAVATGTAVIKAEAGEKQAYCIVTVNPAEIPTEVKSITLDKQNVEMKMGEEDTIVATVETNDGTKPNVEWSSANEKVATVKDGVITAVATGIAVIKAESGEKQAYCIVTVNPAEIPTEVKSITLDKQNVEMKIGEEDTIVATVETNDGTKSNVEWSSANEKVATVKDGVITAVATGIAVIKAESGEKQAYCIVTVNLAEIPTEVKSITLDKQNVEMKIGEEDTIVATVETNDGTKPNVEWSSANEKVASVKDGVITAVATGMTVVKAVAGEKQAYCIVTIHPVNKSEINEQIKLAREKKEANYTKESYNILKNALKQAELVADNKNATTEEVENALKVLKEAIKSLKEVFKEGWKKENSKWRYQLRDGSYITNKWSEIGKKTWYYFDQKGYMKTGWYREGTKWFYLNKSGSMVTGWKQIDGHWYCFKSNGVMRTGWYQENKMWYYLKANGSMATNWIKVGNQWYYFNVKGEMRTGWVLVSGKWYYCKQNGAMLSSTSITLKGKTYRFAPNGVCVNP